MCDANNCLQWAQPVHMVKSTRASGNRGGGGLVTMEKLTRIWGTHTTINLVFFVNPGAKEMQKNPIWESEICTQKKHNPLNPGGKKTDDIYKIWICRLFSFFSNGEFIWQLIKTLGNIKVRRWCQGPPEWNAGNTTGFLGDPLSSLWPFLGPSPHRRLRNDHDHTEITRHMQIQYQKWFNPQKGLEICFRHLWSWLAIFFFRGWQIIWDPGTLRLDTKFWNHFLGGTGFTPKLASWKSRPFCPKYPHWDTFGRNFGPNWSLMEIGRFHSS